MWPAEISLLNLAFLCTIILLQFAGPIGSQRKFEKWDQFYWQKTTAAENAKGTETPMEPACGPEHTKNWFIYCEGTILEAVNAHKLYNDSKDFVDSPLKKSPGDTQEAFDLQFGNQTSVWALNTESLRQFMDANFDAPGSELVGCVPDDWTEKPSQLMTVQDRSLRQWALELNGIWRKLCKKMPPEIAKEADRSSLIYVPHEFIAPGGRFREFYYWDAYWIVRGLMASEMFESAKKMILNLGEMIKKYGMVPNGGRVYYLHRSQPPLLAPMVFEYFQHTWNMTFLREMLPLLEKEIEFWDQKRRIDVDYQNQTYQVYQYKADSNVPRPESFKEDMRTARGVSEEQRPFLFKSIASAAESGWDFSSRWLRDANKLSTIETVNILPVDLNAFMCWNFNILEDLFFAIRAYGKARHFRGRKFDMQELLENLFYNETDGVWYDFNMRTGTQNSQFYPSVAMPLFTGCYDGIDATRSQRLYDFMKKIGAFNYSGGIPTSMRPGTGEQWDFPNGFSPLNHIVIEGLRKSQNAEMEEQAFQLAQKWLSANYKVFKETNHMWEKYNVTGEAQPGKGGEYDVQDGFGWTNGVVLDLLVAYRDRLVSPPLPLHKSDQLENGVISTSAEVPKTLTISICCLFLLFLAFILCV